MIYQDRYTLYQGHALEVLKTLPDESVDMVMTSPPYWGLRSYKTEPIDWGDWIGELGLEPKIELYISHLVTIFSEVKRVLKPTGTCWVNIDDSYSTHASGGKGYAHNFRPAEIAVTEGIDQPKPSAASMGMPEKSLCLIPSRFAIAMVEDGWILRNDIVWHKPNPMPESVKDRFTTSWEHLFFFSKSQKYYFEQQFEAIKPESIEREKYGWSGTFKGRYTMPNEKREKCQDQSYTNPNGRNVRDVWTIPTQPNPIRGVHFATFPRKLCEIPIKAGCPIVCKKCGRPREAIYKKGFTDHNGETDSAYEKGTTANRLARLRQAARENGAEYSNESKLIGYTDCGCNAGFEGGVVLDPFAGSGTTAEEAISQGKKAILIELNPKYCELIEKRLSKGIKICL